MNVKYYKICYDNMEDKYTLWQHFTQHKFPTDAFHTWKFDSLVEAEVKIIELVDEDKNRKQDFVTYYDANGRKWEDKDD